MWVWVRVYMCIHIYRLCELVKTSSERKELGNAGKCGVGAYLSGRENCRTHIVRRMPKRNAAPAQCSISPDVERECDMGVEVGVGFKGVLGENSSHSKSHLQLTFPASFGNDIVCS